MYTVVTHDGKFHADDIFGVAVLQLRFGVENINLIRSREDGVIRSADIVLDVGGEYDPTRSRFDHHQNGAPVRENGMPYAAFGLVWKEFGEVISGSVTIAQKIEERLVQPIDAGDNGVSLYELNELQVRPVELYVMLESFMPLEAVPALVDEAFLKAVTIARQYLERVIEARRESERLKEVAREVYENATDKSVLVFDALMKRGVMQDYQDVQVIVYPADIAKTKWQAAAMQIDEQSFATKVSFPESWCGLRDEALVAASGITDAIFCHKNGFLFVAGSKEGAEGAARMAE